MFVSNTIHLATGVDILDVASALEHKLPERENQCCLLGNEVECTMNRLGLCPGAQDSLGPRQLSDVDPVVLALDAWPPLSPSRHRHFDHLLGIEYRQRVPHVCTGLALSSSARPRRSRSGGSRARWTGWGRPRGCAGTSPPPPATARARCDRGPGR